MEIIQQIGSYAGLAAVLGLAVLAGLYFSQARDVKRLREWAGRAPDRLPTPYQQQRVVAQPVPQPAPPRPPAPPPGTRPLPPPPPPPGTQPVPQPPGAQPAPAQAAATGAAPAVATGPIAATPAAARAAEGASGVDAVTQNTVAHPPPRPPPQTLPPRTAPPGLGGHFAREAQLARAREEDAEPAADEHDEHDEEREEAPEGEGPQPPEEAQVAHEQADADLEAEEAEEGAAEEHDDDLEDPEEAYDEESDPDLAALPDPEEFHEGGHLVNEAGPPETGDSPAVAPPVTMPPPPVTASRQPLPPRPAPPPRAPQQPILPPYEQSRPGGGSSWEMKRVSRSTAVLTVGGTALVVAAAAFGVLQLTGKDDEAAPSEQSTPASEKEPAKKKGGAAGPAVDPKSVTVAVLNGTTVGGLARQLGDKLERQGFQLGNVTNNTDQQRAESVVLFAPGHEREAKEVGTRLKIAQREPIDPDSQTRAGDASVVVVTGADLSR